VGLMTIECIRISLGIGVITIFVNANVNFVLLVKYIIAIVEWSVC